MGAIPRERRVSTRRDILRLLRGASARAAELELYWDTAAGCVSRAACVTPKYGRTSVERNRLRRRLLDLVARDLLSRAQRRDYLLRARPGAYELDYQELRAVLRRLAEGLP